MTFIRPNQHLTLAHMLFAIGGLLFIVEMGMMIYFYNRTVNLEALIGKTKDTTQQIAAQNAILERKMIKALDGSVRFQNSYAAFAPETHPEYVSLHPNTHATLVSTALK